MSTVDRAAVHMWFGCYYLLMVAIIVHVRLVSPYPTFGEIGGWVLGVGCVQYAWHHDAEGPVA